MKASIQRINRKKVTIISAITALIISFLLIDFSSFKGFDVWLFLGILLVYSMIFMTIYILIVSFINSCESDFLDREEKKRSGV